MGGVFISFEGPEGSGKSTQVERLRQALPGALVVREPGETALGERIRELVLHGPAMAPAAEMYLFMAARAELLDRVIEPALAAGRVVVADRYHDSTLAYQGGGRGLAVGWPPEFRRPDRTYLLALPPALGLARARGEAAADRMESEPLGFHAAVAAAYDRLAAAEPGRIVRLDATLDADVLAGLVLEDARRVIGRFTPSSS